MGEGMNMSVTSKHGVRRVVALLVLGCAPAWGANVRFLPAIELRAYHDGNVNNVGPVTDAMAGRVTGELGFDIDSPTTSWNFLYAPYHDEYPNEPDLGFTGHVLHSYLDKRFSELSSLYFRVDASRLRTQEFSATQPDEGTSLLPRTTTDQGIVGLGGRMAASQRGGVLWDLEAAEVKYADDPLLPLNDHRTAAARLGWQYRSEGGTTTGIFGSGRVVDYEVLPFANIYTAQATVGHQLGPTGRIELWGGASRLDMDQQQILEPTFNASIEWRPKPLTVLSIGANREISSGSGRAGPTLDNGVFFGWRQLPSREKGLLLTVLAAYSQRDDMIEFPQVPPDQVDYFEISETVQWVLDRHIRFGVFHRYHDQEDRTGDLLDSQFHTFGVLFRWEGQGPGVLRPPFTSTPAGRALEDRYLAEGRSEPQERPPSTERARADNQEPS
jgi:hypothetical protein